MTSLRAMFANDFVVHKAKFPLEGKLRSGAIQRHPTDPDILLYAVYHDSGECCRIYSYSIKDNKFEQLTKQFYLNLIESFKQNSNDYALFAYDLRHATIYIESMPSGNGINGDTDDNCDIRSEKILIIGNLGGVFNSSMIYNQFDLKTCKFGKKSIHCDMSHSRSGGWELSYYQNWIFMSGGHTTANYFSIFYVKDYRNSNHGKKEDNKTSVKKTRGWKSKKKKMVDGTPVHLITFGLDKSYRNHGMTFKVTKNKNIKYKRKNDNNNNKNSKDYWYCNEVELCFIIFGGDHDEDVKFLIDSFTMFNVILRQPLLSGVNGNVNESKNNNDIDDNDNENENESKNVIEDPFFESGIVYNTYLFDNNNYNWYSHKDTTINIKIKGCQIIIPQCEEHGVNYEPITVNDNTYRANNNNYNNINRYGAKIEKKIDIFIKNKSTIKNASIRNILRYRYLVDFTCHMYKNKYLFIIGGKIKTDPKSYMGDASNYIFYFDFETNMWCQSKAQLPIGISGHASLLIEKEKTKDFIIDYDSIFIVSQTGRHLQMIVEGPLVWEKQRQLWIGFYQNTKNKSCYIGTLPKDVLKKILEFVHSSVFTHVK